MKSVVIIGSGFAGISAAINLSEKNFQIKLIECSPQTGGRVKSYFDKDLNIWFDNGQHLLIGGYKFTLDLINKINAQSNFIVQKNFCVTFKDKNLNEWSITFSNSFDDLINLLQFKNLSLKDKFRFISFLQKIKNYDEKQFENTTVIDLLKSHNQTENLIDNFWRLFVESTMNSPVEKASAKVLIFIMKKMFFENYKNARLIIPEKSFYESFLDPAEKFLMKHNIEIIKSCCIDELEFQGDKVICAKDFRGQKYFADYFILAVPYHIYLKLMKKDECKLNFQSILNAHLLFEGYKSEQKFFALWNSPIHWAFFHKTHITLTKSNAEDFLKFKDIELKEILLSEFFDFFPEYRNKKIVYFKVVKEKRATFISDFQSLKNRVKTKTEFSNLFVAGDFVDTGYPSTIESAVISGNMAANEILKFEE